MRVNYLLSEAICTYSLPPVLIKEHNGTMK